MTSYSWVVLRTLSAADRRAGGPRRFPRCDSLHIKVALMKTVRVIHNNVAPVKSLSWRQGTPKEEAQMHKMICGCGTGAPERTAIAVWSNFCAVAPSPDLQQRLKAELNQIRSSGSPLAANFALSRQPRPLGFDDGVIIPPDQFPLDASRRSIAAAALERAPLRGAVRVIVVLVDYSDKHMTQAAGHFNDLFFSTGVLPHGSVKEYYKEVTGGLVDLTGEVVGSFRLPQTLAWYANNNFGIGRPTGAPRANIMADDATAAADPQVNFDPYDNDGNGF